MAQKRMFSLRVVDTDRFMDLPLSAQALYFHLGLHGDDDGFVASHRKIARAVGCSDADFHALVASGYVIPFESGIIVITDWRINNTLQNDRYRATDYTQERQLLKLDPNGRYVIGSDLDTPCVQTDSALYPQLNITKHSRKEGADKPPRSKFSPPTVEEVGAYCAEKGFNFDPQLFVAHYDANGWVQGKGRPIKDWKAAAAAWDRREKAGGREGGDVVRETVVF